MVKGLCASDALSALDVLQRGLPHLEESQKQALMFLAKFISDSSSLQALFWSYPESLNIFPNEVSENRDADLAELRLAWDVYCEGRELALDDAFLFAAGFIAARKGSTHRS